MDLLKQLQVLSGLHQQLTNEQLLGAKSVLQSFEEKIGDVALLYEELGIEDQSNLLELLACFERIQNEVMERFQ